MSVHHAPVQEESQPELIGWLGATTKRLLFVVFSLITLVLILNLRSGTFCAASEACRAASIADKSALALTLGKKVFTLEVVSTDEEKAKGLSGRDFLAFDRGMLFKFEKPDIYGFWMKDMSFSIDMVWVNQQKEVIYIKSDVSPKTYPLTFYPPLPASYVIELPAHQASESGLKIGDKLNF